MTSLYVVETDKNNPRHHGLHTTTAPHLLTRRPGPGDRIVDVFDVDREFKQDGLSWLQWVSTVCDGWRLLSVPAYTGALGDDSYDGPSDDLLGLILAALDVGEKHTAYVPCIFEPTQGDTSTVYEWERDGPDAVWRVEAKSLPR